MISGAQAAVRGFNPGPDQHPAVGKNLQNIEDCRLRQAYELYYASIGYFTSQEISFVILLCCRAAQEVEPASGLLFPDYSILLDIIYSLLIVFIKQNHFEHQYISVPGSAFMRKTPTGASSETGA